MFILKIGGSALTNKKTGESFVEDVAVRVAKELDRNERCVIVHGVGYEGHRLAKKYSLHRGLQNNRVEWAHLRTRVKEITKTIVNILVKYGHPAVEVSPADIMRTSMGRIVFFDLEIVKEFLDKGFIPVMHADGAVDDKLGLVVVSGDTIATDIALRLGASKLIYGTDVDGIIDSDGSVIDTIDKDNIGNLHLWDTDDFSGGMKKKIEEAMRLHGITVHVINLRKDGTLRKAIKGERIGTTIKG